MIRVIFGMAALLAAAGLPTAAAGQSDGWTVDYDAEGDFCWMEKSFEADDGTTSSLAVELYWDADPMLILHNSEWTMEESETTAEVWFSGDWQRPADSTVPALYHKVDGVTHLDLTIGESFVWSLREAGTLVVRIAGGPFESYSIGATQAAVDDLLDCDAAPF